MWRLFFSIVFFWFTYSAYALDLNTATQAELVQIKGIGEKTAKRIIDERQRAGNFDSLEDFFLRIKGMGKKKMQQLSQQGVYVGGLSQVSSQTAGNHKVKYLDHQTNTGYWVRPKKGKE